MQTHLGLYELESAGGQLLEGASVALVEGAASDTHHGDGGAAIVDAIIPATTQRNFSDEEVQALRWKCRLEKASAQCITELLAPSTRQPHA